MMNPGPPTPRALLQARSGERPWPGEPAWRAQIPRPRTPPPAGGPEPPAGGPEPPAGGPEPPAGGLEPRSGAEQHTGAELCPGAEPEAREPTLVLEVDLAQPLPRITGGVVTRVWLLLRIGDVAVGDLLVAVPEEGLHPADVGAAIAARIGARRRRSARRAADGQARSRRRGSTSSL